LSIPDLASQGVVFDYEYLRELEAKIGTAQNVAEWTYAKLVYTKTPENPPHCVTQGTYEISDAKLGHISQGHIVMASISIMTFVFGSSCNICNLSREQRRYSTMSTVGNYQNLLLLSSLFIDHSGLGKEAMYLQNKR
jgi:hypothetical protein